MTHLETSINLENVCDSCGQPIKGADGIAYQEYNPQTKVAYKKKVCTDCAKKGSYKELTQFEKSDIQELKIHGGMKKMTHWKKLTNPAYIGAYAFEPGEEKIATIDRIIEEEIPGKDNGTELKPVLHFREEPDIKPMILNKTNMRAIEKAYDTPYLEEWQGLPVVLCVQKVSSFGGDIVDGVRIRPIAPPVCESCGQPIKGADGKTYQEYAAYTKATYKKKLCADCAGKLKK